MIDWQSFTPVSALTGGMVIGLATALLLILTGRIAGISGIVGRLFRLQKGDLGGVWRSLPDCYLRHGYGVGSMNCLPYKSKPAMGCLRWQV